MQGRRRMLQRHRITYDIHSLLHADDSRVSIAIMRLKPGFHYPSSRPVNLGAFFDTRQLGPSTRVSKNAPEFSGRQLGPLYEAHKMGNP